MRVFCVARLKNFHLPICEDATVSSCTGVIQYRLQKSYDSSYSWPIDERFLPPLEAIKCPLDQKPSTVMRASCELQGSAYYEFLQVVKSLSTIWSQYLRTLKLYLQRIVEFEKSMYNAF